LDYWQSTQNHERPNDRRYAMRIRGGMLESL